MSSRWISMSFSGLTPVRREPGVDVGVGGLDERRFAHAARAPQKRVIGRKPAREALGIVGQKVAQPVDAAQKRHLDPVDPVHGE